MTVSGTVSDTDAMMAAMARRATPVSPVLAATAQGAAGCKKPTKTTT